MKKREIERMLRNSSDSFTPDILSRVMYASASVGIDTVEKTSRNDKRANGWQKALVACAFVVIIAFCGWFFGGYMMEDNETVYLDVNPSVEIITDRYNNVKTINYVNTDAEILLSDYDAIGKDIDTVVNDFVNLCYEKGYIAADDTDTTIIISTTSNNSEQAAKTMARLSSIAKNNLSAKSVTSVIINQEITQEDKEQAKLENISAGKLKIINEIIALDSTYTIDSLKDKSINELKQIYDQCYADNEMENDNQSNGNGNGSGEDNSSDEDDSESDSENNGNGDKNGNR